MAISVKPQLLKDLLSNRYIHPLFLIRVTEGAGGYPSSQRIRGKNTSCRSQDTHCFLTHSQLGGNSESNQTMFCFQSVERNTKRKPPQEEQYNSVERPELEPSNEAVMGPFTYFVNF